jgi:hypothetical protein
MSERRKINQLQERNFDIKEANKKLQQVLSLNKKIIRELKGTGNERFSLDNEEEFSIKFIQDNIQDRDRKQPQHQPSIRKKKSERQEGL